MNQILHPIQLSSFDRSLYKQTQSDLKYANHYESECIPVDHFSLIIIIIIYTQLKFQINQTDSRSNLNPRATQRGLAKRKNIQWGRSIFVRFHERRPQSGALQPARDEPHGRTGPLRVRGGAQAGAAERQETALPVVWAPVRGHR